MTSGESELRVERSVFHPILLPGQSIILMEKSGREAWRWAARDMNPKGCQKAEVSLLKGQAYLGVLIKAIFI